MVFFLSCLLPVLHIHGLAKLTHIFGMEWKSLCRGSFYELGSLSWIFQEVLNDENCSNNWQMDNHMEILVLTS